MLTLKIPDPAQGRGLAKILFSLPRNGNHSQRQYLGQVDRINRNGLFAQAKIGEQTVVFF